MIRWAALALWLLFYGAYFAKQLLLARRGIQTNRMGKGEKPARAAWLERLLMVATFLHAALEVAGIFLGRFLGPVTLPTWLRGLGLTLAAMGVVCFIAALIAMRDSWRAGIDATQKTKLITGGIYAYSRNPAFLGFDLLYIGLALALSSGVLLVAAALQVMLFHIWILEEEKFVAGLFGADYAQYRATTPRYFRHL